MIVEEAKELGSGKFRLPTRMQVLTKSADDVSSASITQVSTGAVGALVVPEFIPSDIALLLAERLLHEDSVAEHTSVSRLQLFGVPFFSATDYDGSQAYYEAAQVFSRRIRNISAPHGSPLDAMFGFINDCWPTGLKNERLECGRRMSPGIVRIFRPGIDVMPHHDRLDQEMPDSLRAQSLVAQLGINLYLSVPERGGDLELFFQEYDPEAYARLSDGSYGINRSLLEPPSLVIHPAPGDLLLFSSRLLHGISEGVGTSRVTMSGFIGVRSACEPLTIWG